ncbi:phytanoyl-CoA dioxygenase family protein [bacterium]|nr:phytanoyl-CoA dioxygenase family protein [bacterium]
MHILSAAQKSFFHENGYLVLEGFSTVADCQLLMRVAASWVEKLNPEREKAVFSTKNQGSTTQDYFLESGDKVRIFMEEEKAENGQSQVNKLGHALHQLDPIFKGFSHQKTTAIAKDLGMKEPVPIQSMFIFKSPKVGGEVNVHQDATFLYTEPVSVMGFWHALQDATLENGCLWALPGGHKLGLKSRFVRDGENGVRMDILDETPLPEAGFIPLEVPAGTLVLLHGLLPHYSDVNRSKKPRQAFTLHVIDDVTHYPENNWLKRSKSETFSHSNSETHLPNPS